jgi:hypothetical protein
MGIMYNTSKDGKAVHDWSTVNIAKEYESTTESLVVQKNYFPIAVGIGRDSMDDQEAVYSKKTENILNRIHCLKYKMQI